MQNLFESFEFLSLWFPNRQGHLLYDKTGISLIFCVLSNSFLFFNFRGSYYWCCALVLHYLQSLHSSKAYLLSASDHVREVNNKIPIVILQIIAPNKAIKIPCTFLSEVRDKYTIFEKKIQLGILLSATFQLWGLTFTV